MPEEKEPEAIELEAILEMQYIDAKGRVWEPHVDCRVIDEFERYVGLGVFEAVFDVLLSPKKKKKGEDAGQQILFGLARSLFGKIGSLTFLLYESCRPRNKAECEPVAHYENPDLDPEAEGVPVNYADFRASIGKEQVNSAVLVALNTLIAFFPTLEDVNGQEGKGQAKNPFAPSLGEMFTNVRP